MGVLPCDVRSRQSSWLSPWSVCRSSVSAAEPLTPTKATGSRQIPAAGKGGIQTSTQGTGTFQPPEFRPGSVAAQVAGQAAPPQAPVNRRKSQPSSEGEAVASAARASAAEASAAATLGVSFDGLNLRDQRTANGGNQFTVEPPDQGLCVGNGFILETVNDVLRVLRHHW